MQIPNQQEHEIINKYFRYNHLLDGNSIPITKKGSSIAIYYLQENKILSELLGYKSIEEVINFTYKNPLYFRYEIVNTREKNCLFCGGKLKVTFLRIPSEILCSKCNRSCYYISKDFYSHLSPGVIFKKENEEIKHVFHHRFFDLEVEFKVEKIFQKKCARIQLYRKLKQIHCKAKLKTLIFKPNISINNIYIHNIDEIEYPDDLNVKNSHLAILGWKKLKIEF